jgi:hypothetical protein
LKTDRAHIQGCNINKWGSTYESLEFVEVEYSAKRTTRNWSLWCSQHEQNVTRLRPRLQRQRLDLPWLPPAPPLVASPLWPLGHGGVVDLSLRWWESSALSSEGFILHF